MILKRVGKRVKVSRGIFGRYVRFFNQWLNKPSSSADRHALYREIIALPESLLNNMQPRGARCKFRGSQAFSRLLGELRRWKQTKRRNKPSAFRSQQMQTDRSFDVLTHRSPWCFIFQWNLCLVSSHHLPYFHISTKIRICINVGPLVVVGARHSFCRAN